MPYKYKGEDISEEFVTEGFENSSFTILDDYISDTNGLEVVEEKVGKTSGVAVKDATVTSSPGQASENTELEQVDTSSVSEDPKPRFIEFESGNVVYEDTYLKTKAGKKGYPETFDEYAQAFGTRPKEFDLDEVVIKATSPFEKLSELKDAWKSRTYNKDKGIFEVNNFNKELFSQEEETAVNVFRNVYKGSGIEFEEADQITDSSGKEIPIERRFLPQLGTEAVFMKVLDPSTGEYIYSKPIELQNEKVSERNNSIINDFIDSNKDKINIPGWTKESNKLDVNFTKWKKEQFNPQLAIKEDQASEEYLTNEDLFNPYKKYVYTKGIKQEDGTTISGTSRVLKTIQPYEDEINNEIVKIKRKNPNKSNEDIVAEAKIAVRNNLYESARNEAVYSLNEQYINESEDKDKAQGLLYASLIKEKTKQAENYNSKSKKFQIASEKVQESRDDLKRVLTIYSEAGAGGVQTAKELNDIVKKYGVNPVAASEVVSDPVFNSRFNLDKKANVSANLYNLFNAIDSSFNSNIAVTKEASSKVNKSIGNISDIATSMNAVSKNYELHEKYLANVGLGLSDIVIGTSYLGASILTLGQSDELKKLGSKYVQATNEIRESYVRDVSFDDAFSSPGNTGKFIAQEVSNQIPILLAMAASGGAAGIVVGASSAGGKMMDMQNEITTGSADYSDSEVWLKSLGYGLAEGVFAQITTVPILRRAKLNWLENGAEQIVNNSTKNYFKSKSSGLIYEPLLEAAGEVATAGVQNLIDAKPFTQGMDHAGASGFGFGLLFAAVPFFKGAYNSQFSTYESLSEVRKLRSEITDLEKRFVTSQSSVDSESSKQIASLITTKTERLNDKIKEQEVIINNNLTHRGASFVTQIVEEQVKLQNEAKSIQENKNLDKDTRSELIKDLKNQFNSLVQIKQVAVSEDAMLANETEWEAFKGLDKLKSREYLNTAESILKDERDGREVSGKDVNRKAYDLYFGDIVRAENAKQGKPNSTVFKKFKSFETVEDAIADLDTQENLDADEKNIIIKGLRKGNDGYADPVANTQVAVVENQVKNQRRYTKTHEVGHAAFWELLGKNSNNEAFKQISDQLLVTLKNTDKKVYDKFIKDGIDDDKGNIVPAEVISRFLEYVSENKITNVQKAKGVAGLFGVIVQKQFNQDYDFDFRGEQDIFNFVVGIGKKIKDGTLTTSDIKAAKEGDLIKGITENVVNVEAEVKTVFSKNKDLGSVESLEKKLEELEESYDNQDIDAYQYEQKRESLDKEIIKAEESARIAKEKGETVLEEPTTKEVVKKPTKKIVEQSQKEFETESKKELVISKNNKKLALENDRIVNEMKELGVNKVSEIKDPIKRKEIKEALAKNNLGAIVKLANKADVGGKKILDEDSRVDYDEFYSGFSKELTALTNSFQVNKGVPFGAYMARNLPLRYGQILEEALQGKLKGTKSLDTDAGTAGSVKEISGDVNSESSFNIDGQDSSRGLEVSQIDVRKFGPAIDKINEISKIVEVEEGERPSYKDLANKYLDQVSMELFNVPGKKIKGGATLKDSEAKSLQALFVNPNNIRKLIKTMPPYNVAGSETTIGEQAESIDVSKDIKGKSIGLSNKFMKQFYQPVTRAIPGISSPKGRSLGETSQGQVYELKPEFRGRITNDAVKDIQRSVGVTEKGVPSEKISDANRSKYGTTLTGFAKSYVANVINIAGRLKQTDKQEQADTGAGKASIVFSKADSLEEGINPKTLLSTKTSIKTLSTKQNNKKSSEIFEATGVLFLNNIGDVDSFLNDAVDYLKNIKLKDKDLQKNIRRIATASSTRGNLTEYYNWHKLDNNNTLKEALGIKKLIPKKWNSSNDIEAEFNDGTVEGIEVKMNWKDIMGSGGLFFDGKKVKSYTYNNGEPKISDDIVNEINNNQEIIDKLLTATENAGKVESIVKDGKVGMPFTLLSDTESQARSSRKELNRPKFKDISMSIDQVLNHYKKKDVGLFIVGDELFYVQDKRGKFKEMGIPKLNTDASIKLRVKTSGIKLRKTTKDVVDSYTLTGQYQFNKKPENGLKFSKAQEKDLDKAFNDILENKSGIDSKKRYGIVEAITKGSSKGRFNFFIPPSAEDFVGLLYPTLGKGKVGDAQMSWYKKNLIDPYAEAMNKISKSRIYLMNNYNLLKKQLDVVPKDLAKKIKGTDYTKEQAVRVYIWNKQKMNIPGISDADVSKLSSYVADDANLQTFGDQLINMQMGDGYIKPKESWPAGTITTDILEGLNTTKRAKYLKAWQENVDAIFSEENLNKLQAIYGLNYRKALENMLKRMKTGRNRSFPGDSLTGRVTDWLTGSVGTIMFLNTRSAVLQTISAINFVNFTDNNVLAAGKAFANQKQYWADFMKLMNSDFLKERRGGLRINVNEADIADMAKKGGAKGAISKLLELGFAPTQIADSFAIASGGSTFYRNRINTYLKEKDANGNNLYTEKQAEKKAFEDFRETAEESQQSSRADRISQQQASPLGRVVLAFANTPAQYARIIKKAASDLKNGRGDAKTNISKIIYYGFAQNLIFNALQQALFAVGFGDEEPEDKEKEKKYISIANGMLDSILRGSGIGGSIISVGKNAIIKLVKELDKDRPKLQNIASEVLKISPPISSKYSRLVQAGKSYDWNKDEMKKKGLSLDNPAFLAGGNVLSALTNIPLDRAIKKANNVVQATSQDLETWERIALLGGWQAWELGIEKEKKKKKKKGTLKSGKIKTRKLDI